MTSVRRPRRTSLAKDGESLSGVQPDLFQQLSQPAAPDVADLDIHYELLGSITHAIREAKARGLGRARIVDAMNRLLPDLERPITERQLNAWTAASKEYSEFPARFLPAFCVATDCDLPIRTLAQTIARDLIDQRELLAKQIGEETIQAARHRRAASEGMRRLERLG